MRPPTATIGAVASPLPAEPLRGRFAPSPTGKLHLGNAWAALCAYATSRATGGRFVLRVEDLDPARSRPGLVREQLEDLRWLGLSWDEGPDVGGPVGPYVQSEREDHYARALGRLETFPCTCTRRELRKAWDRAEPGAAAGRRPYPGTCLRAGPRPGRPAARRWVVPAGPVAYTCLFHGRGRGDPAAEVGAPVLRRSDGAFAYTLAVVVDDAAMGIDVVVRGRDLLAETPLQVALARALGLRVPRYLHVPLVLGPRGHKLSKRAGGLSLAALRRAGAAPEAVVAALARGMGLCGPSCRRLSADEFVAVFDPRRIRRDDWVFDPEATAAAIVAG